MEEILHAGGEDSIEVAECLRTKGKKKKGALYCHKHSMPIAFPSLYWSSLCLPGEGYFCSPLHGNGRKEVGRASLQV